MNRTQQHATSRGRTESRFLDAYMTPKSLIWMIQDYIKDLFKYQEILEPCCGEGSIVNALIELGYTVITNDIVGGVDYLTHNWSERQIITNPPFKLWNNFVVKAKSHCDTFAFIGPLNYLGSCQRNTKGILDGLSDVFIYDRGVDFREPLRSDGKFKTCGMISAMYVWRKGYTKSIKTTPIDTSKWKV